MAESAIRSERSPQIAYYTDGIGWSSAEWVKSILLFFDGVAVLVPPQEDEAFERSDETVIAGMRKCDCLRILRPADLVDTQTAQKVVETVTNAVEAQDWRGPKQLGTLDLLYVEKMGSTVSKEPFELMARQLKERRLAVDWEHGASIAVDRRVGTLTLSVLGAECRRRGEELGIRLTPVTDDAKWGARLQALQRLAHHSNYARIINSDVVQLGVDVGAVPVDEIIDFRRQNRRALDNYRAAVVKAASVLEPLNKDDQLTLLAQRREELLAARAEVEQCGRKFVSSAGVVSCAIGGVVWTCLSGDPTGAILGGGGLLFEAMAPRDGSRSSDLSYIVSVATAFRSR